jgi:hypothetical protein
MKRFKILIFAGLMNLSLVTPVNSDTSTHSNQLSGVEGLMKNFPEGIPYPFEEFLKRIKSIYPNLNLTGAIVPKGRSPETSSTDLSQPRILISLDGRLENGNPIVPIFLGYAEKLNKLQLISWDEKTKKAQYFEAKDYFNSYAKPLPVKGSENKCQICHQGSGPIFSEDPWNEYLNSADFWSEVKKQNVKPSSSTVNLLNLSNDPSNSIVAFDLERFDHIVGDFDIEKLTTMFCDQVASQGVELKLKLFKYTLFRNLSPTLSDAFWSEIENSKFIEEIKSQWPAQGVGFPTSKLVNTMDSTNPQAYYAHFPRKPGDDPLGNESNRLSLVKPSSVKDHLKLYSCFQFTQSFKQMLKKQYNELSLLELLKPANAQKIKTLDFPQNEFEALNFLKELGK